MKMKNKLIIIGFLSFTFFSCVNEKVVAPSAEFNIQILDKVKNVYVNLDKPYQLKVNTEYQVISENSSEYNSFYMGDSIKANNVWTFHIYYPQVIPVPPSTKPKKLFQGLALIYSLEIKKSIVFIKYPQIGKYKVTFVAADAGNEGNVLEFAIKNDSVTVVP